MIGSAARREKAASRCDAAFFLPRSFFTLRLTGQLPTGATNRTKCAKNDAFEVELSASRTQDTALSAVVERTAEFTATSYETAQRDWSFRKSVAPQSSKEAHGDPC